MHFFFPICTFLPEANYSQHLFLVYVQHCCNPVTVICAGTISAKSICSISSCLLNILKRKLVRFFHNSIGSNSVHTVYCTIFSFALCTSYYQIRMTVGHVDLSHVLIQVHPEVRAILSNTMVQLQRMKLLYPSFESISPCCLAISCTYASHIQGFLSHIGSDNL